MLSVAGLYLFSVADSATAATSDKTDTLKGIALMLLAVCSEATVSTMQVFPHEHVCVCVCTKRSGTQRH